MLHSNRQKYQHIWCNVEQISLWLSQATNEMSHNSTQLFSMNKNAPHIFVKERGFIVLSGYGTLKHFKTCISGLHGNVVNPITVFNHLQKTICKGFKEPEMK